jgi:hypothetical protein
MCNTINRFNGFSSSFAEKTIETVNVFFQNLATRLKPGVNESFASGSLVQARGCERLALKHSPHKTGLPLEGLKGTESALPH